MEWKLLMLCVRALADKVAASGFYVVVPDYFYGDPYNPSNQESSFPVWIKDHGAVRSLSSILFSLSILNFFAVLFYKFH